MPIPLGLLSTSLSCLALVASLGLAACGTGNNTACDGKAAARCGSGGSNGSASAGAGGYHSTSSTVLKIEGTVIYDLSKPSSATAPSNPDAGNAVDGAPVMLRGVSRSGTEYQCVRGLGIFDGPDTEVSIQAIASWKINAVRVPLNESCWLSINGAPTWASGNMYKSAIQHYVTLLHKYDIFPILELHWAAPGAKLANEQIPMPDADHAIDFWKDVALTFKDDLGVIFELYNEPFPSENSDSDAAWECWKNGCLSDTWAYVPGDAGASVRQKASYQSIGFSQLVAAVRETEGVNTTAHHVILLGGVQYSNSLTQWSKYKPDDPANNLGAAWHIYNFNRCSYAGCFDVMTATINTAIVVTEFGQDDCHGNLVSEWMRWFDTHTAGYLAWAWDADHECRAASDQAPNPWPLISNYDGTPSLGLGQTVHDHFAAASVQ